MLLLPSKSIWRPRWRALLMHLQLKTGHLAYTSTNHLAFCGGDTGPCCCGRMTGFRITVTGVTDAAGSPCYQNPCGGINATYDVPTATNSGTSCSGSYDSSYACALVTPALQIDWTLTCNGDGSADFSVTLSTGGSTTRMSKSFTIPATTDCCDISESGIDSYDATDTHCEWSGATFSSIVPYGGECPS